MPKTPTDESYAVVVTAQGCPATSTCTKIVSITDDLATVNLFPNPTNGRFFIDLVGPGVKHISVVDLTGKRVHNEVTTVEGLVEIKLATPGGVCYLCKSSIGFLPAEGFCGVVMR